MKWELVTDYKSILEFAEEICPNAILIDGYDNCITGIVLSPNSSKIVYSSFSIIREIMSSDGATYSEALDYFEFNIVGGLLGLPENYCPILKEDLQQANLN